MRCKTCQYSLKNLTEHRCPECGRAFDPSDLDTYSYSEPSTFLTLRGMLRIAIVCYVVNAICLLYAMLTTLPGEPGILLVTLLMAAFLLVITFPIGVVLCALFWIFGPRSKSSG